MRKIPIRDFKAELRFMLDLGMHPYAEFQMAWNSSAE